jgi:hypothetical protein
VRSAPASRITSARGSIVPPTLVGMLQDRGFALPTAMAACIAGSGALVILLLWMGRNPRPSLHCAGLTACLCRAQASV